MTRIAIAALLVSFGLCAEGKTASKATASPSRTRASKASAAKAPVTIPKAAVEIEPGLWEYKDTRGKTWHYTKTPFGVRRFEPELVPDDSANESQYITAVDRGADTIEFERKTPFGKAKWTRKRTELNDAEKLAVKRATNSGGR